jgi:hypothetical protein
MLKRNRLPSVALAAMTCVPYGAAGCNLLQKSQAGDAAPAASAATSTTPAATATATPEPSASPAPSGVPHHLVVRAADGGLITITDGGAPSPWALPSGFPSTLPSGFALPSGFPSTLPPIPSTFPKILPSSLPSGLPSVLPSAWTPPH